MARDVLLAAVIGAQGLKGEVKAKIFTATPDALTRYGALHDARGRRRYEITALRPTREGEAVIAFAGIADRAAAEALKGTELFIARDALPETGAEEFYHADLIGLEAQDTEGRVLGKVAAIHNYGASDVIEIARGDGDSVMLAFTRETVPVIDIAGGRIVVAVPEDDEATTIMLNDIHPPLAGRGEVAARSCVANVLAMVCNRSHSLPRDVSRAARHVPAGQGAGEDLRSLEVRDIRDHGIGKHRSVDDTPAGGGPGMVMRADVAAAAIDAVPRNDRPLIYLTPCGAPLTQARVRALAAGPGAVLLCVAASRAWISG